MTPSVYTLNRGINKPIEFRGLKAQYIGYLGGGLLLLLILFALLYISGVHPFVCLGVILLLGAGLFTYVYHLSRTYGTHGMMKAMARKRLPRRIKIDSRKLFTRLSK